MKLEAAQKRPNGPGLVRVLHYLFRSEQHVFFFFVGFSLSRRSVIFFAGHMENQGKCWGVGQELTFE